MIKCNAHVVHVAKHINMVGGPGPPLNPALDCLESEVGLPDGRYFTGLAGILLLI